MSDINKGYTFTDKSTDWVSNKETAIRLNKMMDDAKLNLVAGANITITPTANGPSIAATGAGTGTVTSVNLTAGTSISVSGGPITTSGSITVNNTAPDQVVSLTGAGTTTVTGTYPNFTVSSADSATGTVTSVAATAGTGISVSGSPITTSGTLTITNTAPDQTVVLTGGTGITTSGTYPSFTVTNSAPDQTVSISGGTGITTSGTYPSFTVTNSNPDQTVSLTGAGTTSITGTYPSFTVTSNDAFTGTVTSVAATAGTGITISGSPITSSGTLNITNSAPDQTVTLSGGTGITTSGTYPNFTVTNSAPDQTVGITSGTGITVSGTYPNFTVTNSSPSSGGTVTSVSGAGGTTGLTLTGGPITGSGTLTLGGTLVVANGGTGTASPSLVAGTNVTISGSWPNQTINSVAGGTGTVTSVSVVTANGVSGTVATATTTPAITLALGDISAATSKPSATGSVTRTFAVRAGDVFNVKDYGATGDYNGTSGGTADEAAINAAASALVASNVGGCLYFPAGRYKKTTKLTMSLGNVLDGLTIKGDGPGASQIIFVGANLGIEITVTSPQQEGFLNYTPVDVMDLAIATQEISGAGTAFIFNGAKSSAGVRALRIGNVSIRGFAVTGTTIQSWDSCISVTSAEGVFIHNVYASVGTLSANTFIVKYDNGAFGPCSILDISGCSFQGSDKCVWVVGTSGPEGVIVRGTTLVNVNWGVYWDTTTGEEDLKLSDSHINSYKGCVYANNLFRAFIHDNNLFVDTSPTTGPTNLLRFGAARYGTIHDNFMRAPDPTAFSAAAYNAGTTYVVGDRVSYLSNEYTSLVNSNTGNTPSSSPTQWSPDHVGVRLASQTGMHITDNIFQRFGTDVVLESGSNGNMVVNNQAFNNSDVVVAFTFTDAGTNNAVDCQGSTTWDPASLVPGQQDFINISCPGVKFGAQCTVGVPYDVQNMFVQATVTSANNVRVAVYNSSGGTVNLGSGTWTVRAINPGP